MSWLSRTGLGRARQDEVTDGAGARAPAPSSVPTPVPGPRTAWGRPGEPVWPAWLGTEGQDTVKVVVTGPFGAGKSTFVRAVSDSELVQTESPVSDGSSALKSFSTVSLDFGVVHVPHPRQDGAVQVALFGTPGQIRFEFMWQILASGMRVFVVIVDGSSRISRSEASQSLSWFRRHSPDVDWLVAVNRWDPRFDTGELLADLRLGPADLSHLVLSDVRDRTDGLLLLQRALERIGPGHHSHAGEPVG